MADEPSGADAASRRDRESLGMPRWVKFGIIAVAVLVLLVVILSLTGVHDVQPGVHGP